jgi:hypothetical protein
MRLPVAELDASLSALDKNSEVPDFANVPCIQKIRDMMSLNGVNETLQDYL